MEQRNRKLVSMGIISATAGPAGDLSGPAGRSRGPSGSNPAALKPLMQLQTPSTIAAAVAAAAATASLAATGTLSGTQAASASLIAERTQEMINKQAEAQVAMAKEITGIELPKYYNPASVNALKYAEQIKKRQLLWGAKASASKKPEEALKPNDEEPKPAASPPPPAKGVVASSLASGNHSYNKWENTNFGDSQANEKFRRLMGIKSTTASGEGGGGSSSGQSDGGVGAAKSSAKLFEEQEREYERARAITHTQRGLGLGFSGSLHPE